LRAKIHIFFQIAHAFQHFIGRLIQFNVSAPLLRAKTCWLFAVAVVSFLPPLTFLLKSKIGYIGK